MMSSPPHQGSISPSYFGSSTGDILNNSGGTLIGTCAGPVITSRYKQMTETCKKIMKENRPSLITAIVPPSSNSSKGAHHPVCDDYFSDPMPAAPAIRNPADYVTAPSIVELSTFTGEQLRAVPYFTVLRRDGKSKIEFLSPVNLLQPTQKYQAEADLPTAEQQSSKGRCFVCIDDVVELGATGMVTLHGLKRNRSTGRHEHGYEQGEHLHQQPLNQRAFGDAHVLGLLCLASTLARVTVFGVANMSEKALRVLTESPRVGGTFIDYCHRAERWRYLLNANNNKNTPQQQQQHSGSRSDDNMFNDGKNAGNKEAPSSGELLLKNSSDNKSPIASSTQMKCGTAAHREVVSDNEDDDDMERSGNSRTPPRNNTTYVATTSSAGFCSTAALVSRRGQALATGS